MFCACCFCLLFLLFVLSAIMLRTTNMLLIGPVVAGFFFTFNNNNTQMAQIIGRQGSEYIMKNLEMKYVYDYMLYVLQGYGKLMKLDVTVPENATEVCSETMACPITDGGLIRQCMDDSLVMSPSVKNACDMPRPYKDYELKKLLKKQRSAERKAEKWTDEYWDSRGPK